MFLMFFPARQNNPETPSVCCQWANFPFWWGLQKITIMAKPQKMDWQNFSGGRKNTLDNWRPACFLERKWKTKKPRTLSGQKITTHKNSHIFATFIFREVASCEVRPISCQYMTEREERTITFWVSPRNKKERKGPPPF